ncbi:hypothetical protein CEXT_737041 [Caerostris extrusa]|uniref:Uncharacterized protein n=1 Tax=Caerostris extrusa TaxID=172846 RepID=A0AAV4YFB2_CAEEX|nr:hypothetical protein CEXT_737041 [Caerostris extrusa]
MAGILHCLELSSMHHPEIYAATVKPDIWPIMENNLFRDSIRWHSCKKLLQHSKTIQVCKIVPVPTPGFFASFRTAALWDLSSLKRAIHHHQSQKEVFSTS